MGLHGCGKCMKFTMFVANILILAGGIAVLAIGIWTCVDKGFMEDILGSNLYMSSAYILIAMGCVIIVISFFGCLGAIREIKCLLLTYFIILFLIFVILLIGGILGYIFRGQVEKQLRATMLSSLEMDYGVKNGVNETWDTLQIELKCCGVEKEGTYGYIAWGSNSLFNNNKVPVVPNSCCTRSGGQIVDKAGCEMKVPKNGSIYLAGCYDATLHYARDHALIIGGVGIGISCLTVIGMIFACVLFKLIE